MTSRKPLIVLRLAIALLALGIGPVTAGQRAVAQPPPRTIIPIYQTTTRGDIHRYWVPLTLGDGGAQPALLDTGSKGLMVLGNGPSPAQPLPKGPEFAFSYGSDHTGMVMHAHRTSAKITFGPSLSPKTVAFGLIDRVSCTPEIVLCEGSRIGFEDYRIAGEGVRGNGFKSIVGIGFGDRQLPNPLSAFADRWIVEVPAPRSTDPGRLILNPTGADTAGFQMFRLVHPSRRRPAVLGGGVWGCLATRPAAVRVCGSLVFDSGLLGVLVLSGNNDTYDKLTRAGTFTLEIGDGSPTLTWDFAAPEAAFARPLHELQRQRLTDAIVFGVPAFVRYSVLYDWNNDAIGLKLR